MKASSEYSCKMVAPKRTVLKSKNYTVNGRLFRIRNFSIGKHGKKKYGDISFYCFVPD